MSGVSRQTLNNKARVLVRCYYKYKGFVPRLITEIIEATKYSPDQPRVPGGNGVYSGRWTSGDFNVDGAVNRLNQRTAGRQSGGRCAQYVRDALDQGGGLNVKPPANSISAKDYGSSLENAGFSPVVSQTNSPAPYPAPEYQPQKGDVAVIQPVTGHPDGHMEMYNGQNWVSDFQQRDFWPGNAYRSKQPSYTIYRHS